MKDLIEIIKSLQDLGLLLKGFSKTIQNVSKEQTGGFLSMLLGTLGASILGNILEGKGINRAGEGAIVKSVSKETKSKKTKSRKELVMEIKKSKSNNKKTRS